MDESVGYIIHDRAVVSIPLEMMFNGLVEAKRKSALMKYKYLVWKYKSRGFNGSSR